MNSPNPIVVAAAPELVAVIEAIQSFITTMGPDPTQWIVKFPGASLALQGAVLLQLPTLATAEGGALQSAINTTLAGWISKLQAAAK
ncbi:MAG: hypothetical protein WBW84_19745 [Acidobacteriaceae bacterium]